MPKRGRTPGQSARERRRAQGFRGPLPKQTMPFAAQLAIKQMEEQQERLRERADLVNRASLHARGVWLADDPEPGETEDTE